VKLVQASEHTLAQLPNAPPVLASIPTTITSEGSPSSVLAIGDSKSNSVRLEKHEMADVERERVKASELDAANVRSKELENREGPIEAGGNPRISKEMKEGLGVEEKFTQEGEGAQGMATSGACGPEILLGGGMEKGSENEGQDGEFDKERKTGSTAPTIAMIENGIGVKAKIEEKKVPAQSGVSEFGREGPVRTENGQIRSDAGFVGSATAVKMGLGPPQPSNPKTLNPKTPPAWQQWENVANLLSKRRAEIAQQAAAKKQEELDKRRKAVQEEGAEGNDGEVKDEGDRGASVGLGHVAEEGRSKRETESGTGHAEGAEKAGGERASLDGKPDEKKVERSTPGGLYGFGGKGDLGTGADSAPRAEALGSPKLPVDTVKINGSSLEKAAVTSVLQNGPSRKEANAKIDGGGSTTDVAHGPASQTAKPLSFTASHAGADQTLDPSPSAGHFLTVPKERSTGGLPEARNSPSEKTKPGTGMGASGVGVRGAVKPRAPRLGALGPTLAYLRSQQNQLG
jgi:hypothetical protein